MLIKSSADKLTNLYFVDNHYEIWETEGEDTFQIFQSTNLWDALRVMKFY